MLEYLLSIVKAIKALYKIYMAYKTKGPPGLLSDDAKDLESLVVIIVDILEKDPHSPLTLNDRNLIGNQIAEVKSRR